MYFCAQHGRKGPCSAHRRKRGRVHNPRPVGIHSHMFPMCASHSHNHSARLRKHANSNGSGGPPLERLTVLGHGSEAPMHTACTRARTTRVGRKAHTPASAAPVVARPSPGSTAGWPWPGSLGRTRSRQRRAPATRASCCGRAAGGSDRPCCWRPQGTPARGEG